MYRNCFDRKTLDARKFRLPSDIGVGCGGCGLRPNGNGHPVCGRRQRSVSSWPYAFWAWTSDGLQQAKDLMAKGDVHPRAIAVFAHSYGVLASGRDRHARRVGPRAGGRTAQAGRPGDRPGRPPRRPSRPPRWSSSTAASARRWAWTRRSRCWRSGRARASWTSSPSRCWRCGSSTTSRCRSCSWTASAPPTTPSPRWPRTRAWRPTACRWTSCRTASPSSAPTT